MTLSRYELTPQMQDYDALNDPAHRNYLPYLMYFQRANFSSPTVTTDRCGFRTSVGPGGTQASAGSHVPPGPVRILAGGSAAFGAGASSDSTTLPSLLWSRYAPSAPWLNFGGWSYNPAQEAMLLTLHRHLLGDIDEIVIFSGVNAIIVARFPEWQQGGHGAFFFCGEYFAKMEELRQESRKSSRIFGRRVGTATIATFDDVRRDIPGVIEAAAEVTLRHLDIWRRVAGPTARISYVLQPMARWMPRAPAPQEQLLFDERDQTSGQGAWEDLYGDIATTAVAETFASALRAGCEERGARFLDLNPVLAEAITPQDWVFVDRVHLNDAGHDIVAKMLAEALELT